MPSFTFVSTANAFVLRGATPVFVDVRADTLNLDETLVEAAITDRTRAIVPVHYGGVACEMDALAERRRRPRPARDRGRGAGTRAPRSTAGRSARSASSRRSASTRRRTSSAARAARWSSTTRRWSERAEIIREKGTNRRAFFRGQVDKYTWVDIGSSFPPSELAAAFLWAQLERFDWLNDAARGGVGALPRGLRAARARRCAAAADRPGGRAAQRAPLLPAAARRGSAAAADRGARARVGSPAVFHYVPLHSARPPGGASAARPASFPVTDDVSARLVRLPLWIGMTDAQIDHVITSVQQILG